MALEVLKEGTLRLLMILGGIVVLAIAAWYFILKPKTDSTIRIADNDYEVKTLDNGCVKINPCGGLEGTPGVLCEAGRNLLGGMADPVRCPVTATGQVIEKQPDGSYYATKPGEITQVFCEDPDTQVVEAQRLVTKLNAGRTFTCQEIAWAKKCEPTLYNMIKGRGCPS